MFLSYFETQSYHFGDDLFVFFQAIVWSIMKASRSSLNILFQCVRQVGFEFSKTCSLYIFALNMKQMYSRLNEAILAE